MEYLIQSKPVKPSSSEKGKSGRITEVMVYSFIYGDMGDQFVIVNTVMRVGLVPPLQNKHPINRGRASQNK